MQDGSHAVLKIRTLFRERQEPLTHNDISVNLNALPANAISSTLSYLLRQGYVKREQVANAATNKRKFVWRYEYSDTKFKDQHAD